jgi:hypothetical protein
MSADDVDMITGLEHNHRLKAMPTLPNAISKPACHAFPSAERSKAFLGLSRVTQPQMPRPQQN